MTLATLGEKISTLRKRRLWEPEDLAGKVGISVGHLYKIEADKAPNVVFSTIIDLADVLGVTPDYLADKEDRRFPLEEVLIRQSLRIFLQQAEIDEDTSALLWKIARDKAGPNTPSGWRELLKYVRPSPVSGRA